MIGLSSTMLELITQVASIHIRKTKMITPLAAWEAQEVGLDLKMEMLRTTIANDRVADKPYIVNTMEVVASKEQESYLDWERTWRENVRLIDKMPWPNKIRHMSKYTLVKYSENKENPFPHPPKMTSDFLDWLNMAITKDQYGSSYNPVAAGITTVPIFINYWWKDYFGLGKVHKGVEEYIKKHPDMAMKLYLPFWL
ncbi:hypothetical protein R1flu_003063 [Riccia fluitans]|uniref:Uncharacterized protein n=1 Tax=Riccia fluitans TaxID=41844 RepID=A0ABD1Y7W9_9MARC